MTFAAEPKTVHCFRYINFMKVSLIKRTNFPLLNSWSAIVFVLINLLDINFDPGTTLVIHSYILARYLDVIWQLFGPLLLCM